MRSRFCAKRAGFDLVDVVGLALLAMSNFYSQPIYGH
jgi:hypothetical protein